MPFDEVILEVAAKVDRFVTGIDTAIKSLDKIEARVQSLKLTPTTPVDPQLAKFIDRTATALKEQNKALGVNQKATQTAASENRVFTGTFSGLDKTMKAVTKTEQQNTKAIQQNTKAAQQNEKVRRRHTDTTKQGTKAQKDFADAAHLTNTRLREGFVGFTKLLAAQARFLVGGTLLFGVFNKIRDVLGRTRDITGELARAMSVATSDTLEFADIQTRLRDIMVETSSEMGIATEDVSEVLFELGSAGLKTEQVMAGLQATIDLSIGTQAEFGQTTKQVAGIFNVYGDQLDKTLSDQEKFRFITDVLAKTFQTSQVELSELVTGLKFSAAVGKEAGFSFEQLVAILAVLNNNLIKGGQAGRGLRTSLLKLESEADTLREAFGTTFEFRQVETFNGLLSAMGDELKAGGDRAQRASQIINQVFGRLGVNIMKVLAQNAEDVKTGMDNIAAASKGAAKELADIQVDTLSRQMGIFSETTTNLLLKGLEPLAAVFLGILKPINALLDALLAINKASGGYLLAIGGLIAAGALLAKGLLFVAEGLIRQNAQLVANAIAKRAAAKGTVQFALANLTLSKSIKIVSTELLYFVATPIGLLLVTLAAIGGAYAIWRKAQEVNIEGLKEEAEAAAGLETALTERIGLLRKLLDAQEAGNKESEERVRADLEQLQISGRLAGLRRLEAAATLEDKDAVRELIAAEEERLKVLSQEASRAAFGARAEEVAQLEALIEQTEEASRIEEERLKLAEKLARDVARQEAEIAETRAEAAKRGAKDQAFFNSILEGEITHLEFLQRIRKEAADQGARAAARGTIAAQQQAEFLEEQADLLPLIEKNNEELYKRIDEGAKKATVSQEEFNEERKKELDAVPKLVSALKLLESTKKAIRTVDEIGFDIVAERFQRETKAAADRAQLAADELRAISNTEQQRVSISLEAQERITRSQLAQISLRKQNLQASLQDQITFITANQAAILASAKEGSADEKKIIQETQDKIQAERVKTKVAFAKLQAEELKILQKRVDDAVKLEQDAAKKVIDARRGVMEAQENFDKIIRDSQRSLLSEEEKFEAGIDDVRDAIEGLSDVTADIELGIGLDEQALERNLKLAQDALAGLPKEVKDANGEIIISEQEAAEERIFWAKRVALAQEELARAKLRDAEVSEQTAARDKEAAQEQFSERLRALGKTKDEIEAEAAALPGRIATLFEQIPSGVEAFTAIGEAITEAFGADNVSLMNDFLDKMQELIERAEALKESVGGFESRASTAQPPRRFGGSMIAGQGGGDVVMFPGMPGENVLPAERTTQYGADVLEWMRLGRFPKSLFLDYMHQKGPGAPGEGGGDGDTFVFNIPPDFIAAMRDAPEDVLHDVFRKMGRMVRTESQRKFGRQGKRAAS